MDCLKGTKVRNDSDKHAVSSESLYLCISKFLNLCVSVSDECMATPDPGPCRAAFPRFYYDFDTGTCQAFMYGGCRGNKNSYGTEEECLNSCSIKDGERRLYSFESDDL